MEDHILTQSARLPPTIASRYKRLNDRNSDIYSLIRYRNNSTQQIQIPITGQAGGAGQDIAGFLRTGGDTMMGPIAFFPKLLTIAADAINIGISSGKYSSRVIVTPESGAADDLITITGAQFEGQLLFIQGIQTDTITIKNSGNIETLDGNDFLLSDDDILIFMFDSTDNKWQQVSSGKTLLGANKALSNLASVAINTTLVSDTNSTDDLGTTLIAWRDLFIDEIRFVNNSLTTAGGHNIAREALTPDTLVINVPTNEDFQIQENSDSTNPLVWIDTSANSFRLGGLTLFRIDGTGGGSIFSVAKTGTTPAAFSCTNGFQFDADVTPSSDSTLLVGSASNRWAAMYSLVYRLPTTLADSTTRILSNTDGIEFHLLTGDFYEFFINAVSEFSIDASGIVISSTTTNRIDASGTGFVYGVAAGDAHAFAIASSTKFQINDAIIIDSIAHRFVSFSDATRPAAGTAGAGAVFYSTTDAFLLYSDGTNWRNVHDNAIT